MVQVHQYVSLIDLPASGNRASKLAIFSDLGGSLVFLFKTFSTNRKPEPQRAAYPVETPGIFFDSVHKIGQDCSHSAMAAFGPI